MKIQDARCPACDAGPGTLDIVQRLMPKRLGTYSLAGAQTKVSAYAAPVLCCRACGLQHAGTYDADGEHASFPPLPEPPED
jgi:hypothetical protein